MGSSYAAKQARRREREKKTGYQKTPFHSDFLASPSSSVDNFHSRVGLPPSGRGHEWSFGERNDGQQAHMGNVYVQSGIPVEAAERQTMQSPARGTDLFLENEPPIPHTSVCRDEFSHPTFVKEALNGRRGSANRGRSDDPQSTPEDQYSFLSHGSQQWSQPQPPSQPHSQHFHCHPHNSSDQFSMDVQHASLATNSLPHAVTVIQRYTPPKEVSIKETSAETSHPIISGKRKTLEYLKDIEKGISDSLRNLENSIREENSLKEQIDREYTGMEMAVAGSSVEDSVHRGRHHSLWELEERQKETHKRLKKLEVDKYSAKTRLQEILHEIKLCELELDAEESDRMIEELRGSEYSVGDRMNSHDQTRCGGSRDVTSMSGLDSLKRSEYMAVQRMVDGKEGQSLSTQCPPVQVVNKPVQNRSTHPHPLGEGKADPASVKQLINAFSSGHHCEVVHARQRSGASDSYLGGVSRGSDGSDGYRSLDRLKERSLDIRDSHGRSKPDHHYHSREGSFGSTNDKLGSSRTRQPGVGGWDPTAPPPTLPKPSFKSTVSSDTASLSTFTMDSHIEHCSLSPSESDLREYPRPPPPGANWQGPNQLPNIQLPPTPTKWDQTKDVGGVHSTRTHKPSSNAKQWTDREPGERRARLDKATNGSAEDQQMRHEGSYQSLYPPTRVQEQCGSTHYPSNSWRRRSKETGFSLNHQVEPPKLQIKAQHQGLLQFQNPPLGTEEATTSSQVTGCPEDITSFDAYLYNMGSHGNEPIITSQRSEGSTGNDRSGLFSSAQKLDVVGPGRVQDNMISPRVVPVTTRKPDSYYSRPRPPPSSHKPSGMPSATPHRPATGKRPNTNYGGKTDFLLKYPQGVTTVSRTDL